MMTDNATKEINRVCDQFEEQWKSGAPPLPVQFIEANGKPIGEPLRCSGNVTSVAISPDGRLIAAGSRDHSATVWHAQSGALVVPPIRHIGPVSSVAFDEGQSVLASASGNSVFLWDIKSMQLIARNDCLFKVDALRISDWKVYVSHEDGTSFVWDISTSVANLETLSRNSVLHSGRRLNQRGFVESIEPEELRAFWLQSIRDGIR